jgi:hypothetical protein
MGSGCGVMGTRGLGSSSCGEGSGCGEGGSG